MKIHLLIEKSIATYFVVAIGGLTAAIGVAIGPIGIMPIIGGRIPIIGGIGP